MPSIVEDVYVQRMVPYGVYVDIAVISTAFGHATGGK